MKYLQLVNGGLLLLVECLLLSYHDLNDVKALHAEKETQKFLSAATCGDLQANVKCKQLKGMKKQTL